jgi:hypothetical protein
MKGSKEYLEEMTQKQSACIDCEKLTAIHQEYLYKVCCDWHKGTKQY